MRQPPGPHNQAGVARRLAQNILPLAVNVVQAVRQPVGLGFVELFKETSNSTENVGTTGSHLLQASEVDQ